MIHGTSVDGRVNNSLTSKMPVIVSVDNTRAAQSNDNEFALACSDPRTCIV
jgi:hypothetical protein